jgi:hypothetical protein
VVVVDEDRLIDVRLGDGVAAVDVEPEAALLDGDALVTGLAGAVVDGLTEDAAGDQASLDRCPT